jgi:hypothetical protein
MEEPDLRALSYPEDTREPWLSYPDCRSARDELLSRPSHLGGGFAEADVAHIVQSGADSLRNRK